MRGGKARIVSLLPAATEIICELGLGDQLVGVSHACNWPPAVERLPRLTRARVDSSADSAAIDAEVKRLAATHESLYVVDDEVLAALRPDLIITQSQCDVCAVNFEHVARLAESHPALAGACIEAVNPRSLEEVLQDVEHLAAAAGSSNAGRQCTASLRRRIEAVCLGAARHTGPKPRVAVIEWIDPLMVAGNWTPELATLAGGDYSLAVAGQSSPYVAWGDLAAYAPEILFVAPCGFDLQRSRREAIALHSLPGWRDLPAVRNGEVHVVDGDAFFNRPGPRLVDSLELLAEAMQRLLARAGGLIWVADKLLPN